MKKYILSLDQGTTSSRAILFDKKGNVVAVAQKEFTQIYPKAGWVEHNANQIWETQLQVAKQVIDKNKIDVEEIDSIGITNQRETTVLWNKKTGEPIYNAIVWQDKRTANICEHLKEQGLENYIKKNTGLVVDSYFSATKIKWIFDNVQDAKKLAEENNLCFGTIDSWLIFKLTNGKTHCTDFSNASRTMIFNIKNLCWDDKLLQALEIPKNILPKVKNSSEVVAETDKTIFGKKIKIAGIAGDQQAALFGQKCFKKGMAKNTYGTGCFMLLQTETDFVLSKNGLLTTIAWSINNKVFYALEGSIFIAGAAIQWLRDELKLIDDAPDSEYFALKVEDTNGVFVVPAFVGLGAPYWNMDCKGAIFGLTRGANKAHLVRATLESLAYQTKDVLLAMQQDAKTELKSLKVDGGASNNNLLMQFQSDILNCNVVRPKVTETTAFGAALFAGLATGFYKLQNFESNENTATTFKPNIKEEKRAKLYNGWKEAVRKTMA